MAEDPHTPDTQDIADRPGINKPEPVWRAIGQSQIGAGHEQAGTRNQDAVWKWDDGRSAIAVVSDGHGSATSFRSHLGSEFASRIGELFRKWLLDDRFDSRYSSPTKRAETLVLERLPRFIHLKWQQQVDRNLATFPFTDEELRNLAELEDQKAVDSVRANPRLAYGATFLAVVATPAYLAFLQLGDGDILSVSPDGQVSRPLPDDDRLIADATTSLCLPNAYADFRVQFQPLPPEGGPAMIFVSTDGYANSFSDPQAFLNVGRDYYLKVREHGLEAVDKRLSTWLAQVSKDGSGDDISVALLVNG